jgi:hypothetical protein
MACPLRVPIQRALSRLWVRLNSHRCRYKVERSFAWLGNFRRLLIRWERQCDVYEGFFTVAIMMVCLRRVG